MTIGYLLAGAMGITWSCDVSSYKRVAGACSHTGSKVVTETGSMQDPLRFMLRADARCYWSKQVTRLAQIQGWLSALLLCTEDNQSNTKFSL